MVNHEALLRMKNAQYCTKLYIQLHWNLLYSLCANNTLGNTDIHMPEIYSMGLCKMKKVHSHIKIIDRSWIEHKKNILLTSVMKRRKTDCLFQPNSLTSSLSYVCTMSQEEDSKI
jgi:hypothetical protein